MIVYGRCGFKETSGFPSNAGRLALPQPEDRGLIGGMFRTATGPDHLPSHPEILGTCPGHPGLHPTANHTMPYVEDLQVRNIANMMRNMAWQRAKGELLSMLETYQSTIGFDSRKDFESLDNTVKTFIGDIEGYL